MNDKLFKRILAAITAVGTVSTLALILYTVALFSDCSIISYIANWR
ncbi:MAG: hypothetical protein K2J72_00715 [Oscillospiraceae bacterium]|nr:hypothetical protein [Oscillospiraceae bacterium]